MLYSTVLPTAGSTDPCNPINYNELNEPHRSTSYTPGPNEQPICDNHLQPGWYRFTSGAGGSMPTSCPKQLSCGTVAPIWLNGSHPSVADGTVWRQACAHRTSGNPAQTNFCCDMTFDMPVRNCSGFYVYGLRPTPACFFAYCAGDRAPCPAGMWSPDSFTHCKHAYPAMAAPPALSDPIISRDNKSFSFNCSFGFRPRDADQRFEVIWTSDGKENPLVPPQVVSDPARSASLDGRTLTGHVNSVVGCQVRSFYQNNPHHKSPFLKSNTYFAGVIISSKTPGPLVVTEKDFETNISITSTIPILCEHTTKCCLTFKLNIDDTAQLSVPSRCDWFLCKSDWDTVLNQASIEVPLVANKDLVNDGDKQLMVTFEHLIPAAYGSNSSLNIFKDFTPDPLPVEVKDDKSYTCSLYNDVHMDGFDRQHYNFYKTGDFKVCTVPSKNFDVQVRTWVCGTKAGRPIDTKRGITCVCGVVIREQNDVIRIDQCDQQYGSSNTSPTVTYARNLRNSTVVQRSKDGSEIYASLPSGTLLKVHAYPQGLNVYLTTSAVYAGLCNGICGTNDNNTHNDFALPNGSLDNCTSDNNQTYIKLFRKQCMPNRFINGWRAPKSDSLFEKIPKQVAPAKDEVALCPCKDNHYGHPAINCTAKPNLPVKPSTHPALPTTLNPFGGQHSGWTVTTRRAAATYTDTDILDSPYQQVPQPDYPSFLQWPSGNGMTQRDAEAACLSSVKRSQLYNTCSNISSSSSLVEHLTADCMADILSTSSTDFLDQTTEIFTSSCQALLTLRPASYVSTPDGRSIMKPEYKDDVCQHECHKHGRCGGPGGQCVCRPGWEGQQCHIKAGAGVAMGGVRGGATCDVRDRPCRHVFFDVSNLDLSDKLVCKVQYTDDSGRATGEPVSTKATYLSSHRLACEMPELDVRSLPQSLTVSASNDGIVYGNTLKLVVLSSSGPGGCEETDEGCEETLGHA